MAITAADLILYGALNRPEADGTTTGGAIDVDNRPVFTALGASDAVGVVSSDIGDTTQDVTITGRDATGAVVTEILSLNGQTRVPGTQTFERILKVVLSADAAGVITVDRNTGGATVGTIPIAERGFYRMFLLSASESGAVSRFEKVFWKNNHGSLTLNSATVDLTADPLAKIKFGLAPTKDDSGSETTRKTTVPTGVTFFDDNALLSVPTGILATLEAIGTWIEQDLGASDTPFKSSFTTQLAGTSV